MIADAPSLFVAFPTVSDEAPHWWLVRDGVPVSSGIDTDPLLAAGLKLRAEGEETVRYVALLPSALTVVRWHEPIAEINEKQALAAAILDARKDSVSDTDLHISAIGDDKGQIVTAAIGQDVIGAGITHLQNCGIDPDHIVPAGWLISPVADGVMAVDLGFDQLLRGSQMIAPDEPAMRTHLIGDTDVSRIEGAAVGQALANGSEKPLLDLRSGLYAKKVGQTISMKQKRLLGWLIAALLLISFAIPVLQLAKYQLAAGQADTQALTAAEKILGPVSDPEAAERQLDERLVTENRGDVIFSVLASALFSAVQQTPGVSIGRMSFQRDGLISAELSAVRNEDINPALIALQDAGFIITATPRTDATGSAKADITARAP